MSALAQINAAFQVLRARLLLRGAQFNGMRIRLRGTPVFINGGTTILHNRVQLFSTVACLEIGSTEGGLLEIGERTFINSGCSIVATLSISIGAECHIGPHVMLFDNAWHRVEPERRNERPESAPVVLGRNVWLGARVIVMPGVTIGAGTCIGAGSVVTQDIPPRVFAAGVPARVVRVLDSPSTRSNDLDPEAIRFSL